MAANNIGGFFLELGVKPDKNAFEAGGKLIDSLTEKSNKLIGTVRNVSVVMGTAAIASGAVESSNYKTARAIGVSIDALNTWKAAAKIAGVNANGLVSSMGRLADVMNHMTIDGRGLEQYAEQLGKLELDFEKLKDMSPDQAYQTILETAQEKYNQATNAKDQQKYLTIVGDILGTEGESFFVDLLDSGKSLKEFLQLANNTVFTTEQNNKDGRDFKREVNVLQAEFESLAKLFGDEIATTLKDPLHDINEWIQQHGPEIQSVLKTVGDATQGLVNLISPIVGFLLSNLGGDIYQISQGVEQMMNGDVKGGAKIMFLGANFDQAVEERKKNGEKDWAAKINAGARSIPGYRELVFAADKGLEFLGSLFGGKSMEDGVMRPDGTVTQVAPDDWVFAARNVGDLAQAFIPQGIGSAGGINTFTINQTFNIGPTKDMPQILRQQAYNGARDGLMQTMAQSSQRLQMMSGTR